MLSLRTPVLNSAGMLLFRADTGEADRLVREKKAKYAPDGRSLLLKSITGLSAGEAPAGRTHTSRGGLLAVIGRSQQYTISERGQVNGFKTIFSEDRHIFNAAVLDALGPAAA